MRNLTPIKVKILLKQNGHAKYPNFNELNSVQQSGKDWCVYIMEEGLGWHYDVTGHSEDTVDSPVGQQWGVLIVPQEFADESVLVYPDICTKLTEQELESFYNDKSHCNEADEIFDQPVLDGIKTKQDLGLDLTAQQLLALDPNNPTSGIVKNNKKYWADFKLKNNINIV